jgi:hypothetical protein
VEIQSATDAICGVATICHVLFHYAPVLIALWLLTRAAGLLMSRAAHGSAGARNGMRSAAGVLFLVVGLWSVAGGGCSVVGARVAGKMADAAASLSKATDEAGAKLDTEAQTALARASSMGSGLLLSGSVILLAGVLAIVAGIMAFMRRGRLMGLVASGVGALGELLFFALVGFNIVGLVKILVYGFAVLAVTRTSAQGRA